MLQAHKEWKEKIRIMQQKQTGYPSVDRPWLKFYSAEALHTSLPECSVYQFFYQNNRERRDADAIEYFGRNFKTLEKMAEEDER